MAKQKVTRKELLKKPDEFLSFSARAAVFVRKHQKQFSYVGIVVLAAVVVYLGINTYLNYINKKGQGAYNTAYYDLMARMSEKGEAEDLKEPEELFQKVMAEYGRSKVSRLAPPQVAFLKYRDKKYDEAIALYLRFIEDVPQNSPYRSLASVALAACYEEKGELEKAIEGLKAVISGPDDFFKEQAMLSLARVYTLSNQTEKAREVLEDFVNTYTTSPFLPIAKARLGN